jgi:hypothetical protein
MKGLLFMKKTILILFLPFLIIFTTILFLKDSNSSYANKLNKKEVEIISVNLSSDTNSTNFIVEIDKTNETINIAKNYNKNCENYINVDIEKTTAILSSIDKSIDYSTSDYIHIFNSIKPYLDTNMSYMDIFSLYNSVQDIELGSINLLQK